MFYEKNAGLVFMEIIVRENALRHSMEDFAKRNVHVVINVIKSRGA